MLKELKIRDEIEELEPGFDEENIVFEDVKPAKFEPEVNIKTELDYTVYKISEAFESIYNNDESDVHSGQ